MCLNDFRKIVLIFHFIVDNKCHLDNTTIQMKGQSEIAYLPKFANMMLIVMVIVITEILYIILIFDCFENQ